VFKDGTAVSSSGYYRMGHGRPWKETTGYFKFFACGKYFQFHVANVLLNRGLSKDHVTLSDDEFYVVDHIGQDARYGGACNWLGNLRLVTSGDNAQAFRDSELGHAASHKASVTMTKGFYAKVKGQSIHGWKFYLNVAEFNNENGTNLNNSKVNDCIFRSGTTGDSRKGTRYVMCREVPDGHSAMRGPPAPQTAAQRAAAAPVLVPTPPVCATLTVTSSTPPSLDSPFPQLLDSLNDLVVDDANAPA